MSTQPTEVNWEGQTLLDRSGEKIGTIEEIYLVEETGRPEWALVKLGMLGRRTTLVPLTGASRTSNGIRTTCEKSAVEKAPAVDSDEELSEQQAIAVYRHYGIDYGEETSTGDGGAAAQGATASYGQAQTAPAAQAQPAAAPAQPRTGHDVRQPKTGADRRTGRRERRRERKRDDEQPRQARGAAPAPRRGEQAQAAKLGPTLKRTVKEFSDDKLTHWAASLTYYAVLSIFPALLALVSILGLLGSNAIQPLIDNLSSVAPGAAKDILTGALEGIQSGGGHGLLFIVSLAGAIWAASGYISAFMDASNAIYDIEEGRGFFKRLPLRIGVTVLMLVLLAVAAMAVVLTGPVAEQAGNLFGVGDSALSVWNIAKWPVLILLVAFMFAVLYYSTPNVKQPGLGALVPGGVLAVVLWLVVSVLFAFYVANFGSYNKTYGALGGVIVFLVWLWLTNIAILLGAEFNAERARGRHVKAGHSPDDEPYLPPRSQPA